MQYFDALIQHRIDILHKRFFAFILQSGSKLRFILDRFLQTLSCFASNTASQSSIQNFNENVDVLLNNNLFDLIVDSWKRHNIPKSHFKTGM
ncbi:hypothetical protein ASC93_00660 [Massilia sp. Root335]|nr:hypothetical protein ASC93_00660 [Massilia sp. Root335]